MKKVIRCLLFIVLFFIVLGFTESKAEPYTHDEYKAKYGNLMLVATYEDAFFDPSGIRVDLDIGESFRFNTYLVDYDVYYEQGFDEMWANKIKIDADQLEDIKINRPNLIEYENGVITAKAEGYVTISFSCEYQGKKYDSVDFLGGNIGVGEDTIGIRINYDKTDLPDEYASYVNIDNSLMVLDKNNSSDSATVMVEPTLVFLDYDSELREQEVCSFEWSVDDESIASIVVSEKDQTNPYRFWESEVVVIGKKNGTTKVRCKVSAPGEEGGIATVEKVIDVTVKGFEEEEEPEKEPTKEDEKKDKDSDDTVAPKPLSQTGEKLPIILLVVAAVAVISYKKYKSHKIK